MSPPFGGDWGVWITLGLALFAGIAAFFYWKGRLDEWRRGVDDWIGRLDNRMNKQDEDIKALIGDVKAIKRSIDDWKGRVDNQMNKQGEDIKALMIDVETFKRSLEKDSARKGMLHHRSPLVPSEKAIEILEELNILSQVDANIPYIQEEIEKRSQTSIYRDIEDPEERFIEIAPGVIHALIKKGKIEEKKIDDAMDRLEKVFPTVTYYGVLLDDL
jgi:hypothetical protein